MSAFRSIPVRGPQGEELTVYEFLDGRFLGSVRRMKLCTGELVERVDEKTFVAVTTGELLARVEVAT